MKILLVILLILFLIGQVRVGVKLELRENVFSLWARLGAIRFRILPSVQKEKKSGDKKPGRAKKEKKPKEPAAGEKPAVSVQQAEPVEKKQSPVSELSDKVDLGLDYARALLPVVLDLAKHFFRKLQVDTLRMVLTVGNFDPADAAMLYGQANGALGALWYPLTEAFHVKDGSARVALDFGHEKTDLYVQAALSLKIGQLLWIALYFGLRGLRGFLSVRSRQKKKTETRKAA